MEKDIMDKIQVHMPFALLRGKFLSMVLSEGINPEIAISHRDLDRCSRDEFSEVGRTLSRTGRRVTLHAPFVDLRPGAIDPEIRRITRERISRVLDLAGFFHPLSVVCHAAFDARYYYSGEALWLKNCVETFQGFLPRMEALACPICVENVYETEPTMLKRLLDEVSSPYLRFCFDTGHCNVFGTVPFGLWIDTLGSYLTEIHIHDNDGTEDRHLPPGDGGFPFADLFAVLRRRKLAPVVTLETHSLEHFRKALSALKNMDFPSSLPTGGAPDQ